MKPDEALNRAAAYCSRQERCVDDVIRKLEVWDVDPEKFGAIIEHLKKEKFIDEMRYASFYARDKFRFNSWGKIKTAWALKQKKIDPAVVEKALETIDPHEYREELKKLIRNKFKQLKEDDAYKAKVKLIRFARSKGYETGLIYPLVEKIMDEKND